MIAKHSESRPDSSSTRSSVRGGERLVLLGGDLSISANWSSTIVAGSFRRGWSIAHVRRRASRPRRHGRRRFKVLVQQAPSCPTAVRIPPSPTACRCRQIAEADLDAVADLLTRGFPRRPRDYWADGAGARCARRADARGLPAVRLPAGGRRRGGGGVILLIFADPATATAPVALQRLELVRRAGLPQPCGAADALAAASCKHVTYLNTSPAGTPGRSSTRRAIAATARASSSACRRCAGARRAAGCRRCRDRRRGRLAPSCDLLRGHAAHGCLVLVCETRERPMPFVFLRRAARHARRAARCSWSTAATPRDFVRCAGPLGRFLLRRGVAAGDLRRERRRSRACVGFFNGARAALLQGPDRPAAERPGLHRSRSLFGA